MPEEQQQDSTAITWVKQHSIALWTTVGSALLGILMSLLRESVSPELLLTTLLATLTLLIIGSWTFAGAASRQRSKIATLESRIRDLAMENSSYRNPLPISDADQLDDVDEKILLSLAGITGLPTKAISEHIGAGIDVTHLRLTDLKRAKMIFIQYRLNAKGYWYLGIAGKRYLAERKLIQ